MTAFSSKARLRKLYLGAKLSLLVAALSMAAGCGISPEGKQGSHVTGVILTLENESLGLARDAVKNCRIVVYPVIEGKNGAIEGGEHLFPVDGGQEHSEFSLTGLTVGMKEFDAVLLSESGQSLGEGKVLYEVKPGNQTLDPLIIKLVQSPDERRTVVLEAAVSARVRQAPVTYADVKPIFMTYGCPACHSAQLPLAGLAMNELPFVMGGQSTDQVAIVTDIIGRMTNAARPMPATGIPPAETTAIVQRWLEGGLLPAPAALVDAVQKVTVKWRAKPAGAWSEVVLAKRDGLYVGAIDAAIIGDTLECKVVVLGAGDVILYEEPAAAMRVERTGPMRFSIDFEYDAPNVRIPIIIQN